MNLLGWKEEIDVSGGEEWMCKNPSVESALFDDLYGSNKFDNPEGLGRLNDLYELSKSDNLDGLSGTDNPNRLNWLNDSDGPCQMTNTDQTYLMTRTNQVGPKTQMD
ncbi:hypothetical protein DEO72_LG9g2838 [Vigna unguiculata]|uniref:Uncharacterized protein n=1 Tax=Vigna unguiculata TaxID=3917 RepID=A0A4D6N3E2_VIGUN|nr:hypothetical protein DEO72_LG9g2838 [Vigna unguiculata]